MVYQSKDKVCKTILFYIPLAWNLTTAININEVNLIISILRKGNIVATYYLQTTNYISPLRSEQNYFIVCSLFLYLCNYPPCAGTEIVIAKASL